MKLNLKGNLVIIFGVLVMLSILLTGCNDKPQPTKETPTKASQQEVNKDYLTYQNAQYNIKLKYPDKWELREGFMGTVAMFLAPRENANDNFQENISILVQDLSAQPMDLEAYTKISVDQIKQIITKANMISSEKASIAGNEAHKIIYTGNQGQFNLKWMQCYTIKNKKAYVVTFTAEQDKYDNYVKYAEELLKTVEIK